jgi:DNA-binding HxlR family transcriptional regulator
MNDEKEEYRPSNEGAMKVENILIDCLGCKWTMALLDQIHRGINRPGQLVRSIERMTTKVLNENIDRMLRNGLIEKQNFYEIPPRVEYKLTPMGIDFYSLLIKVKDLQDRYKK